MNSHTSETVISYQKIGLVSPGIVHRPNHRVASQSKQEADRLVLGHWEPLMLWTKEPPSTWKLR